MSFMISSLAFSSSDMSTMAVYSAIFLSRSLSSALYFARR
ncbi:MAG: sortase B protein-sorting domain-containing protein [Nitrososphaerota archaeon]|nr:sortase B protein-sorting domain-containing protein [Nitrososphaerota archaeon]MDG7044495.1 sortase B protein-sorting domain-containing protein [Nitrososphaerota archaeon]MDG7048944.1 sortase B protein-sorting domain-containing protein [Nitrososphaerota archaeon]MDG7051658.1 sortase B protein-sorting domain-containing protein [Nitrososphaerota archaeon]